MDGNEMVKELSAHLMQCGALMPIDWVTTHGADSRFMEAYGEALRLLKLQGQGLLAELPCRPGDTVWVINKKLGRVFESEVVYLKIRGRSSTRNVIKTRWVGPYGNESTRKWGFRHFGKYLFATAEEAERALGNGQDRSLQGAADNEGPSGTPAPTGTESPSPSACGSCSSQGERQGRPDEGIGPYEGAGSAEVTRDGAG